MSPKEQGNLTVEWFQDVIERCTNVLVHEKSVSPALFCLSHDGKMTYTQFGGISSDERVVLLITTVRDIIRRADPLGYILVVEGVCVDDKKESQECLTFVYGFADTEVYLRGMFSHNAKGEIELGTLKWQTECDGLFTNLRNSSPIESDCPRPSLAGATAILSGCQPESPKEDDCPSPSMN